MAFPKPSQCVSAELTLDTGWVSSVLHRWEPESWPWPGTQPMPSRAEIRTQNTWFLSCTGEQWMPGDPQQVPPPHPTLTQPRCKSCRSHFQNDSGIVTPPSLVALIASSLSPEPARAPSRPLPLPSIPSLILLSRCDLLTSNSLSLFCRILCWLSSCSESPAPSQADVCYPPLLQL